MTTRKRWWIFSGGLQTREAAIPNRAYSKIARGQWRIARGVDRDFLAIEELGKLFTVHVLLAKSCIYQCTVNAPPVHFSTVLYGNSDAALVGASLPLPPLFLEGGSFQAIHHGISWPLLFHLFDGRRGSCWTISAQFRTQMVQMCTIFPKYGPFVVAVSLFLIFVSIDV